jgi:choline kinase
MKSIIIAAGSGRRIPEFSKDIPKSLIKINRKSILKRQIDFMKELNISEISIIKGFKSSKINFKNIKYFYNKNYKNNEQLDSFFTAKKFFTDDLLVTFSDIVYDKSTLRKIIKSNHNFSILIQKNWKKKYNKRFDHPIEQADKVFIKNEKVIKIGKKLSINQTNGEFIGVFKIKKVMCNILMDEYKKLKNKRKTIKLQIHDFFNYLIKKNIIIKPIYVEGKYMEIDTYNDFKLAKKIFNER